MIMCLIKLIWTDWNLYQKVIECCVVSSNRKASLVQADILKFANSLKLRCKQIFILDKLFANIFFPASVSCKQFFCHFLVPPGKY